MQHKLGYQFFVVLILLLGKVCAQQRLIQFQSNIIYLHIPSCFQVKFPENDTNQYAIISNDGLIKRGDTSYLFSASHVGSSKIYITNNKTKSILDSIELVCKQIPTLTSIYGTKASGSISSGEIPLQQIIWTGLGPKDWIAGCIFKSVVQSYTSYIFKADTFYKHHNKNNKISHSPDEYESGEIILIDEIESKVKNCDDKFIAPNLLLIVDAKNRTSINDMNKSDNLKNYEYSLSCFAGNCRLKKQTNDSGFIIKLYTDDSLHKVIFEEKCINGKSMFQYNGIKKYMQPEPIDTQEVKDFIKWDIATQWDSFYGKRDKYINNIFPLSNPNLFSEKNSSSMVSFKSLRNFFSKEECQYLKNLGRNRNCSASFFPKNIPLISDTINYNNDNLISWPTVINYSIPLITKDKKYAIVYKSYSCGILCAAQCCFIYKRIGRHKWKLYKRFDCWVS